MTFTIPGKPQGKGRARFGNGRTYTPAATADYMNLIRYCFEQNGGKKTGNPVEVEICAYFPIPKTTPKAIRQAMRAKKCLPMCKPDNDNIEKVVFDALNGFAWHDDTQVVCNNTYKIYHDNPMLVVKIDELHTEFYKKDGKWVKINGNS